ncbi:MAG: DUF2760 domain-containing protein [Desulfobacteraceae bacterium]
MDQIKAYLRRSLFIVIFFTLLLSGAAIAAVYPKLEMLFNVYSVTYSVVFVLLFALLQWMFLRNSLIKALAKSQLFTAKNTPVIKAKNEPSAREREKQANDRRREFLHLFSVLQREGRLMDFFAEDLDDYDDAQIGAAVRNIHANCKKTLSKYIHPKAVVSQEEGSNIEISPGFDPAEIKLTGNVVGEPPFKGIVRHRGWQTKKFDLPVLSENQNPLIIAPAEVEIE